MLIYRTWLPPVLKGKDNVAHTLAGKRRRESFTGKNCQRDLASRYYVNGRTGVSRGETGTGSLLHAFHKSMKIRLF